MIQNIECNENGGGIHGMPSDSFFFEVCGPMQLQNRPVNNHDAVQVIRSFWKFVGPCAIAKLWRVVISRSLSVMFWP